MATHYSNRSSSDGTHSIKAGLGFIVDFCEIEIGSTALTNADVINLFTIPKGAKIMAIDVVGAAQSSGTDVRYTIGDSGDADRFCVAAAGLSLTSATTGQSYVLMPTKSGFGYEFTEDTDVFLTFTAGTNMADSVTLQGYVHYYMSGE